MDRFIEKFDGEHDDDLNLCLKHGVAYQRDMTATVAYDASYLAKIESYDPEIAAKVNAGRVDFVTAHSKLDSWSLLDIGAGDGLFLGAICIAGFVGRGYDVIPETQERLKLHGLFADDIESFDVITMWDTIEHLPDPGIYLDRIQHGAMLFVSVPVFSMLSLIRRSKHYRPGEHLYYWTPSGFIHWMRFYGFRLVAKSAHEMLAGRESIGAFAFCKDLGV